MGPGRASTAAANLLRLRVVREVLAAGRARGVEPILLKGAALILGPYAGDLSLRPMTDVDLLVPPGGMAALEAALQEMGFRAAGRSGEAAYRRSDPGLCHYLDLHEGLWYLGPRSLEAVLARAVRLPGGALGLAPADEVLYLAAHAVVRHARLRGPWREDLRRVLASHGPTLDWGLLRGEARRLNLAPALALALRDAGDAGRRALARLGWPASGHPPGPRWLARLLDLALSREGPEGTGHLLQAAVGVDGDRFRYLARQLFPGGRFLERRYGRRGAVSLAAAAVLRPVAEAGHAARLAWRWARATHSPREAMAR
ncbi:MAG: nucleotidyltransferase family protein [Planctomycetes bacterium]|nr:nucleotidyltransferase family protein [Planctomycetota bacterium]